MCGKVFIEAKCNVYSCSLVIHFLQRQVQYIREGSDPFISFKTKSSEGTELNSFCFFIINKYRSSSMFLHVSIDVVSVATAWLNTTVCRTVLALPIYKKSLIDQLFHRKWKLTFREFTVCNVRLIPCEKCGESSKTENKGGTGRWREVELWNAWFGVTVFFVFFWKGNCGRMIETSEFLNHDLTGAFQ